MELLNYLQDGYFVRKFFHFVHIVGFVSWFSALLYLCRIFVYHKSIMEKTTKDVGDDAQMQTFATMSHRLHRYIATPAMALTLATGIKLALLGNFFSEPWIHTKLTIVIFLIGYHHHLGYFMKRFKKNAVKKSSNFFRWYNEVGSLLLVFISSLAVFRHSSYAFVASLVLITFVASIFLIIRISKKALAK